MYLLKPKELRRNEKFVKKNLSGLFSYCNIKISTCLLAGAPTNLSPSGRKAITDGVVRTPSEFSITFGVDPSITDTHEFVVPKSMPIT